MSQHLIKRISSAECPRLPVPTTTSTNKSLKSSPAPKKNVQHNDMCNNFENENLFVHAYNWCILDTIQEGYNHTSMAQNVKV